MIFVIVTIISHYQLQEFVYVTLVCFSMVVNARYAVQWQVVWTVTQMVAYNAMLLSVLV